QIVYSCFVHHIDGKKCIIDCQFVTINSMEIWVYRCKFVLCFAAYFTYFFSYHPKKVAKKVTAARAAS
ncbi:MAG: hypothetical protein R6U65_07805, partial [Perlabentimonas sp.]